MKRLTGAFVVLVFAAAHALPAAAQDRPPPATPAPATAPEAGPAPEPAPAPPPPAAPGTLVLQADADDLLADLTAGGATQRIGLKTGDNRVELAAGAVDVLITGKDGREVQRRSLTLGSGETQTLAIVSRALVRILAPADATVELDSKEQDVKSKGPTDLKLVPGPHKLVIQRPGYFGRSAEVTAVAGKTTTVHVELDEYNAGGKKTWGWVGLIGGGALVVTAIAVDSFSKFDELGGDATRWSLFGLGAAGFVGGTMLLKAAMDEQAPIKPGSFRMDVTGTRGGAAAQLSVAF